ncbi:acyl-CoA carboxylase epsilon subunit [Streptomyces sp. E11-3]|uniref:acyl-CoA carboxylase epsilon subunit n=1 Tax=Streptomyces sp. E11-3 TaxID=3110112 RepID=UPI0039805A85
MTQPAETPQDTVLRIVRGRPNEEELAAATLALLAFMRGRCADEAEAGTAVAAWSAAHGYAPPGGWAAET